MTDLDDDDDDDDELLKPNLFQRCRSILPAIARFAPPIISIGCTFMVGYFTYGVAHKPPLADMSTLAISILKSGDASPEMREWAKSALGIQTDIPFAK